MKLRVAFGHLLSMRRHVRAEEAERGVVDLHADADAALVAHHAKQSRCHGGCYEGDDDDWDPTADSGDGGSERDTCKYAHEYANEDLGAHAVVRVFLIMTICQRVRPDCGTSDAVWSGFYRATAGIASATGIPKPL